MLRKILLAFIAVAIVCCSCGRDFRNIRNIGSSGETVVCFGDSLTEGVGAEKGEDYPALLARELAQPVVNAGRSGGTSADGLSRLERDVLSKNPRLVVVLFGANDFFRQLPVAETQKNLEEIIRRIQAHGAMVALVGIRLGLFTDAYSGVYSEVAAKHGALHIPGIFQDISSDEKRKSDAIHPNSDGYRLIAQRIAGRIRPLLAEADRRNRR